MSYLISGQGQEYLGFANYLVHQTLFNAKKTKTVVETRQLDASFKDYLIAPKWSDASDEDYGFNNIAGFVNTSRYKRDDYTIAKMKAYTTQQLTDSIAADVTAVNNGNADITVTDIIFNINISAADVSSTVDGSAYTNDGNSCYGSAWLKTTDNSDVGQAIDTTIYDKCIAAGIKVIHIGWNDLTDSNVHWLRTMARYETESANHSPSADWDERKDHYARNITRNQSEFPTTDNDHTLNIDKILNKDATEYSNLCTFLDVSALSAATWKGYVDTYLSAIS